MSRSELRAILLGALALAFATAASSDPMTPADCAAEADRAARGQRSTMSGAVRSGARGAVFGAIVGGKDSAGRGAALGAVVGGARSAVRKEDVYRQVYDACMREARPRR